MAGTFNCPVCNATREVEALPYEDRYWTDTQAFSGLSIVSCAKCGFGNTVPELSDDAVGSFYTHVYRRRGSPLALDFAALSRPVRPDYRSLSQLLLATQFVDFHSGDCFLDIGPGPGSSFLSALRILREPTMCAIELAEGAASAYESIYGAKTFACMNELNAAGRRPKIVLSSHSLEHFRMSDVPSFLSSIRESMAIGGAFIAEVPHVDMRIHSTMRSGDSPHFLFFSKESLGRLLESNDFEIMFLESCGPRYDDWWASALQDGSRWVETKQKALLRHARAYLRSGVSKLISAVGFDLVAPRINFRDANFAYGGDRTCLRVVARPKSRHKTSQGGL